MDPKIKYLIWGIAAGSVITVLICFLIFKGSLDSFTIEGGEGKAVAVKIQGKKIEHQNLLDTIWAHQFTKDGLIGWIKMKGYYSVDNDEFASIIKTKNYYSITDPDLTKAIKEEPINSLLSKNLREMEENNEGPWEPRSVKVYISIPASQYLNTGEVSTWQGSKYCDKTLIFETSSEGPIELNCKCKRGARGDGDIENAFHMTKEDFKELIKGDITTGWVNMTIK